MKREELKPKIGDPVVELWSMEALSACKPGLSSLEQDIEEGENPVFDLDIAAYDAFSKSRVAWECSSKWVVNFI